MFGEACPCGSGDLYAACCGPLHDGVRQAETPEQLMRSRYSAYAKGRGDYVFRTWHPRTRPAEVHPDPGKRYLAAAAAGAAVLVAAVAVAAAAGESRGRRPRMMAAEQSLPDAPLLAAAARERHAVRVPMRTDGVQVATAEGMPATPAQAVDGIVIKPWPRALVPGASGDGAYTAGYDGVAAIDRHPVFMPAQTQPSPEAEPPLLKRSPAATGDAPP